jgi:DNA polymerase iota
LALLHWLKQVASQLHSLLRGFAPDGQVEKTSYDDFYIDATAACCNSEVDNSSSSGGSGAGAQLQAWDGAGWGQVWDCSRVLVVTMPNGNVPEQQQQQAAVCMQSSQQQQQQQPSNWHLLEPELQRGVELALQLRAAVKASLGLTVSCGVAPGKLLARLVTPVHKPNAVTGGCGW